MYVNAWDTRAHMQPGKHKINIAKPIERPSNINICRPKEKTQRRTTSQACPRLYFFLPKILFFKLSNFFPLSSLVMVGFCFGFSGWRSPPVLGA